MQTSEVEASHKSTSHRSTSWIVDVLGQCSACSAVGHEGHAWAAVHCHYHGGTGRVPCSAVEEMQLTNAVVLGVVHL